MVDGAVILAMHGLEHHEWYTRGLTAGVEYVELKQQGAELCVDTVKLVRGWAPGRMRARVGWGGRPGGRREALGGLRESGVTRPPLSGS